MSHTLEANKLVVRRFNQEVIGDGRSYDTLLAADFVNRSAPPGMPTGPEGMHATFERVLRPAFPDLRVVIHDQVAEGDRVVTRKTMHGTHRGELFGIAPTGREIAIEVIDIVRVQDGKYVEHWGVNTLASVLADLSKPTEQ